MASRVPVAASACLVASGLLIGGADGAIALADPDHGNTRSEDTKRDDSIGDIVRRAFSLDGGDGDKPSESRQQGQTRSGNGQGDGDQPTRTGAPAETKPTETKPTGTRPTETKPSEASPESTTSDTPTTTKPTTTTESTPPLGQPPPNPPASSGGGGGGQIVQLPRFTRPNVPRMQLPEELTPNQPGGPGVLDAGAGADPAAPVGPAAPIVLPVIVAPPVGLGGGAGGAGAGAAAGAPRAVTAEPPGGRIPSPANAGDKVAVPGSSYRLGYTEYLRTAGLPQVAALAVSGLVGILVLTGAGGFVGYRQAKSGHAVRVSGAARFMR